MSLCIVPVERATVRRFIEQHHSHHHRPNTWVASLGVEDDGRLCCVVVLELPKARLLCVGNNTAEISRVASDRTRHAASKGVAAMTRAALALGYTRLVSYTLLGEAGTSYTAAGWWPTAISAGGSWVRPSRQKAYRDSQQTGAKVRWEVGPDAWPTDPAVAELVRDSAGKIELPPRPERPTLFDGLDVCQ
jgi:hypothetical protein